MSDMGIYGYRKQPIQKIYRNHKKKGQKERGGSITNNRNNNTKTNKKHE
jgi:hypothetical protein